MSIVGGLDIHRKQLAFDWVDEQNDKWERGRISPADREHLADWLTRFDPATSGPVAFAMEGCTGWRYIAEEMDKAGVDAHLAEPADTSVLRGPKRRAKTELTRPDVLILDDFAMRELTAQQADDLYELISDRAQHGRSLITTSNRSPVDWYALFPNPVVAESLLDRLINTSHQIVMNGPSYRPNKRPGRTNSTSTPTTK
jgi:hypothetical protein